MNNEKQISSSKMIHIAGEVIVVASLSIFFTKKIKEMKQEIHELKEELKVTKEGCNQQIKELYQIVDKLYTLQQMRPKENFAREQEYSNINKTIEDEIINKVGPASNILNSAWNVVHENMMNPNVNQFIPPVGVVISRSNVGEIRRRNVPKVEVEQIMDEENDEDIKEELELLNKLSELRSEEKYIDQPSSEMGNETGREEVREVKPLVQVVNVSDEREDLNGMEKEVGEKIKKKVKKVVKE